MVQLAAGLGAIGVGAEAFADTPSPAAVPLASHACTYLPVYPSPVYLLLAGDMSPATAWVLVAALAVAGLGIVATNFGSLITKVCMWL